MDKETRKRIVDSINERLEEDGMSAVMLGTDPTEYAPAIIGLIETDHGMSVAYSEQRVIECHMDVVGCDHTGALEWHSFNTVRGMAYIKPKDNPPILVDDSFSYEIDLS